MNRSATLAPVNVEPNRVGWLIALGAVAALVFGGLLEPTRAWGGILTAGFFGFSIALGASLFAAINMLTGAKWWTPIAPVFPCIGTTLVVPAAALAVAWVFGLQALYPWARESVMATDHLIHGKIAWLNAPFFLARAGFILLILLGLTNAMSRSVAGYASDGRHRRGSAAFFIVVFALCISVASWDWIMSLEPAWFSTMFGVYGFAGVLQAGIAGVIIVSHATPALRPSRSTVGKKQRHDLGSLLFGFSMFWAYIWFCQYMLIWYANLPEEVGYFVTRQQHGWGMLFWLTPILCWVVPFFGILATRAKTNASSLVQVAVIVLIGRWLDVFLMVAPSGADAPPSIPVYALSATAVVLLGMVALMRHTARR